MSTWFYYECLSHEPPLQSREEISQHDDHHVENAIRLAQGLPISADDVGGYFEQRMPTFLLEHQHCAIGIVSEYGDHRPIPGRGVHRNRAVAERQLLDAQEALRAAEASSNAAAHQRDIARAQLLAIDAEATS